MGTVPPPRLPSELVRGLSPRRQELVGPILERPRDYVLLSARKLAEAVGSDAMAVLRAIRGMGFTGYAAFRQYLYALALVQATQLDAMRNGLTANGDVWAYLAESLVSA